MMDFKTMMMMKKRKNNNMQPMNLLEGKILKFFMMKFCFVPKMLSRIELIKKLDEAGGK